MEAEHVASYLRELEVTRSLSANTLRAYRQDLSDLLRHFDDVDAPWGAPAVQEYIRTLRSERGLSPATQRRRLCSARLYCRWLVRQGHVETDPFLQIDLQIRPPKALPRALSDGELSSLVSHLTSAAADVGMRTEAHRFGSRTTLVASVFCLATGVRVGELTSMRVTSLDLRRGAARIMGKGSRERTVYFASSWILKAVRDYLRQRQASRPRHAFLWLNTRGERLSAEAFRGRLARAARGAGIQRTVTPHMLRHTAATKLVEAGVDIRYVQRLLGHRSLSTTELYTHVADEALRSHLRRADVVGRLMR